MMSGALWQAMRRATRLDHIMSALEGREAQRAEDLAARFRVSLRTIYRDMDALRAAGIEITGTPGQGYRARHGLTLPPVGLSEVELEALYLGLVAVGQMEDPVLAQAADDLAERLDMLLPSDATRPFDLHAAALTGAAQLRHMQAFRGALRARQKVALTCSGASHVLRPLSLRHWGRRWSFVGWSDNADNFLQGSLDSVTELRLLPELFVDEPGKTLADHERAAHGGGVG